MFADIIGALAERAAENRKDSDYKGTDGLYRCGRCHSPKQAVVEEMKPYIADGIVWVSCECMEREQQLEAEQRRQHRQQELSHERRRRCLESGRYARFTFAADDGSHPEVTELCKRYVKHFDSVCEESRGLMLMGDIGTGKTFFACCVANALMEQNKEVWVTSLTPLLRACSDYSRDEQTFRRIAEVQLLILDDFRTEGLSERQTELLGEIVDARYRSGLPLIVTTLLSPSDMHRSKNPLRLSRIYDKLLQMCVGKDEKGKVILS